ncbi:hypothetical protein SDC9_140754 [bioreactor metagenome]|uniref:Uncharacterized protein n=1 Tax=bioreactor metagenome TaxID=1076179 RepID=A0A645DVS4_9ZZZZ
MIIHLIAVIITESHALDIEFVDQASQLPKYEYTMDISK